MPRKLDPKSVVTAEDLAKALNSIGRFATSKPAPKSVVTAEDLARALNAIINEIGPGFGVEPEGGGTLHRVARIAREALSQYYADER